MDINDQKSEKSEDSNDDSNDHTSLANNIDAAQSLKLEKDLNESGILALNDSKYQTRVFWRENF